MKALGELNAVEANAALLPFAKDPDPMMRRAALASLARIASPASYAALTGAAQAADYKYEPGNAVGALLEYAKRLGQKQSLATAEKVCRLVMKKTDDPERLATRAAALAVLADARGAAALPDLLKAVDHADRKYRNAALFKAERMRGPAAVQQWVAKAKTVDAERRAEILAMLGRQADPALAAVHPGLARRAGAGGGAGGRRSARAHASTPRPHRTCSPCSKRHRPTTRRPRGRHPRVDDRREGPRPARRLARHARSPPRAPRPSG